MTIETHPHAEPIESGPVSLWAPRLLTLAVSLAVFALLALLVWGLGRRATNVGLTSTPLRDAPSFTLELLNGGSFSLAQVRGQPVIVNFWASWCIPCEDEAQVLQATSVQYRGRVQFVGVDVQDSEPDAQRFLSRFGVNYPNGRDRNGSISIDYGMAGVPETYFIQSDGRIRRKWAGPLNATQLHTFVQELLE